MLKELIWWIEERDAIWAARLNEKTLVSKIICRMNLEAQRVLAILYVTKALNKNMFQV